MTPEQLANIGTLLYGPRWKTELANRLNVNVCTVHRWAAGETLDSRMSLAEEFIEVIDERIAALTQLLEGLRHEDV